MWKPGGVLIIMDVMSHGHPVRDIWLQRWRRYATRRMSVTIPGGEWLAMVNNAMLVTNAVITDRLSLGFAHG